MDNYFCANSVEEQVDYLTDKVKDLNTKKLDKAAVVQATGTGTDVVMSQKAVTDVINENLQTINTEINGKLTKPANPSAESAVTMLADGTVGTKLLSEIGGGGGSEKLYLHVVHVLDQRDMKGIAMSFYNHSNVDFTPSTFKDYFRQHYSYHGTVGKGNYQNENYPSYAYLSTDAADNAVITYYTQGNGASGETTLVLSEFESYGAFSDTVTEV